MDQKTLITLAEEIIAGFPPDIETYQRLAHIPERDVFMLFAGANMIREAYFGQEIHLCTICNGKSGRCSEDCSFCSQSVFAKTESPVYGLLPKDKLQEGGRYAARTPINRYSIVTSGKRLPKGEVAAVAEAISELDKRDVGICSSLGILGLDDLKMLKKAGVTRYHHNLETSESYFNQVCTTHTYQERIDCILSAKSAGLSVCSGGVFGIGETDDQVLELAITLKKLDVDSIPLNFLIPIKGTRTESFNNLTPLRCLKIISLFRYMLYDKDIYVCGGREFNLKELHPLIFYAGASGIMTGNYLTMPGQTLEKDLRLIKHLGFITRNK